MLNPAPIPDCEAERIATLQRYAILDTEKESVFDRITSFAARQFNAPIALVSLIDSDRQWFKASSGLAMNEMPRDLAFCGYTILGDDVLCIADATKDARVRDNPLVTGDMNIKFYCGAPLIANNGHRLGSLCVIDTEPRLDFSEDEQQQLAELAAIIVDQMEMRIATGNVLQEIEHRQEVQHRAAATDRQMRALVDNVPVGIALIDRNGRYLATSNSWRTFISSLDKSLCHDSILELKSSRPDWCQAFQAALDGNITRNPDDEIQLSNGDMEYVRWEARPWALDNGEVEGVIVSAVRITRQVETRKDLERQTELLNAVLENVKDGIVACDADGNYTLFNQSSRVMLGVDCLSRPLAEYSEFYALFEADGTTPLPNGGGPLSYAVTGNAVVDQELIIAPKGQPKRHIIAQAAPLFSTDGSLMGAVTSMADVTAARLAEQKLKASEAHANYVAFHDTLTGLPNRAHFRRMIEDKRSALTHRKTAAFFLDLNQFKAVNDLSGHEIGDTLLKRTAHILQQIAGKDAFVSRLGGDEFIIFKPVKCSDEALQMAHRMVNEIGKPMVTGGHTVIAGVSVGIALYPEHGDTHEDLMRRADLAMYKSKALGNDKPIIFDPVFELETVRQRALQSELDQAIKNKELEVYLQPIVDGQTQAILGAEALARWNHPVRGQIPPEEFIPVAEESGFIIELGDWVMRTAMAAMIPWPDLFLSVNLSPVQFKDALLVSRVLSILEDTGFDPARLELEVTEGLLIYDTIVARRTIETFKSMGIRIALDDFGTGYSSLSYIQSFPFDKVKIDRSFVSDIDKNPQSAAVVQCVVNLATSLGMVVTAEGIETENHEMLLKFIGCNSLQGFKYGRPMPAAEFDLSLVGPQQMLA